MPIFSIKKKKSFSPQKSRGGSIYDSTPSSPEDAYRTQNASTYRNSLPQSSLKSANPRKSVKKSSTRLKPFQCQLAHGSPTGLVSDFTNIRELYQKIADCFDIEPSDTTVRLLAAFFTCSNQCCVHSDIQTLSILDFLLHPQILFCTLNTHKLDMDRLLCGQLAVDDFIFAHLKGQRKEYTLLKNEEALGLTITDNGAGYAFIKRIRNDSSFAMSVTAAGGFLDAGDHIERVNNVNLVGKRHFEVAAFIRSLPVGNPFVIRLVSPEKSPLGK
ncbi:unnamed protein product [Protopolystoma xenopodis]|uniref:PDZ domain-containing protein n=1 Tax=Protopolystoma xenopodis TaxID=117903 RepID=A0A3S5B7R6_9PLAT|nr:unnamed protein product [Protopolystoma xenopodis]